MTGVTCGLCLAQFADTDAAQRHIEEQHHTIQCSACGMRMTPEHYHAAHDDECPVRAQASPPRSAFDVQVGGSHYKGFAIQPAEFNHRNRLSFLAGCVVKRIARHNQPGGKGRQDLEKAKHEIDLLIEMDYPNGGPNK